MNSPIIPPPTRQDVAQGQQHPQQQIPEQPPIRRLTAEEMRAFRECNRESFFYRSLPLAIAGGVGVRILTQKGYFKPSPIYGNYGKYFLATVLGYFAGKISYLGKCRDKLMRLPNSELGDALRKSYGGGKRQFEVLQEMVQLPEINTGGGSGGEHGYAPIQEGSDIYTNPDFSVGGGQGAQQASDTAAQKPTASYDDLRRRNREEYLRQQFGVTPGQQQQQQPQPQQQQHQQQAQSYMPSQQPQSTPSADDQPHKRFSYGSSEKKTATKYGDTDFK